ncbi:YchJ family protein [Celerinatantimonas sp. YJH-8]|uniref:YchJ family protein n=1 Tax=Celerinatantimonas sp. YJH-8 TaxID=3228714 RepID=UPI0038CA4448
MPECYCHSHRPYHECCEIYHSGTPAPTPLALMRSRYSAFVLGLGEYLWKTHHPDFRGLLTIEELNRQDTQWKKLAIVFHGIAPAGDTGLVEFKAWYQRSDGQLALMHERSNFVKEQGLWLYTDGLMNPPTIGRNALCPCGSGKKFKQCCLKRPI